MRRADRRLAGRHSGKDTLEEKLLVSESGKIEDEALLAESMAEVFTRKAT